MCYIFYNIFYDFYIIISLYEYGSKCHNNNNLTPSDINILIIPTITYTRDQR